MTEETPPSLASSDVTEQKGGDLASSKQSKFQFSFKRLGWVTLILLLLLSVIYAGFFFYLASQNALPIRSVKVVGTYQFVKEKDIQATLEAYVDGRGLFAFSEWQAEQALEHLPGIASASIWRIYPDTIRVILREKAAEARLDNGALLATDGSVFSVSNFPGTLTLPLLKGNPIYAKQMLKMLESLTPIFAYDKQTVTGLGLASNGDWSVQLNQQTWVMLGKDDLQNRVINFLTVYPTLLSNAPAGKKAASIDLRYNHGIAVAWEAEAS